jgi:hypothetical protein
VIEEWQAVAGIAASSTLVAGALVAVVRHMLRSEFVPRAQYGDMEKRVASVEKRLGAIPSEHDVSDLTRRLARVETGVAVVQTTIEGVNTGLKRVERNVDLLIEHQLRKEE